MPLLGRRFDKKRRPWARRHVIQGSPIGHCPKSRLGKAINIARSAGLTEQEARQLVTPSFCRDLGFKPSNGSLDLIREDLVRQAAIRYRDSDSIKRYQLRNPLRKHSYKTVTVYTTPDR